MLRNQLRRNEEIRAEQESEIKLQQEKINEFHHNYQAQMNEKETAWQQKFNVQKQAHDTKENEL